MAEVSGLRTAMQLVLAGLNREAVVRGLQVELNLTEDEAETAWQAATDRLAGDA